MIAANPLPNGHGAELTVTVAADDAADERRLQDLGCSLAPDSGVVVLWRRRPVAELAAEIRELRAGDAQPKVVAVLADTDRAGLRGLLRAGADGLVLESDVDECLSTAIAAVRCGMLALPPAFRPKVDRQPLSFREKQVLGMVVRGLTNRQIAHELFLAESTVKTHLSSAFSKLNTRSRAEAAAIILDPDEGLGDSILTLDAAA